MQGEYILMTALADEFSENGNEIFAEKKSVGFDEILRAEQLGYKAKFKLIVNAFEYNGEQVVVIDGARYAVYRTYNSGGDKTELYVESKLGI